MIDLVIRGGCVVTPDGVGTRDVAMEGERIAAVAAPGTRPRDARRTTDASTLVVPGGVGHDVTGAAAGNDTARTALHVLIGKRDGRGTLRILRPGLARRGGGVASGYRAVADTRPATARTFRGAASQTHTAEAALHAIASQKAAA